MLYRLEKVLVDRASTNINQVAFSVNLKSAQSRNVTMAFIIALVPFVHP